MIQYIIILLVIVHLCFYAYKLRKKEGVVIDVWLFNIITSNIIWYFLMYPVAGSELNIISTGKAIYKIQDYVDFAFLVVVVGYFFMWVGKYYYLKKHCNSIQLVSKYEYYTRLNIESRDGRLLLLLLFLPFILYVFYIGLTHLGQDVRKIVGSNGSTRVAYNIAYSIYPFIMGVYGILFFQYRKLFYVIFFLILFLLSFLFSTRGLAFGTLCQLLLFYIIYKGRHLSYFKMIIMGLFVLFGVISFQLLRTYATESTIMGEFLYGNTFCDLRDLAWILSGWDEKLLYGKTYVAGILSFMPSSLLDFRTEWSFGRVSLRIADVEVTQFHGGLRGTIYGESFLNFGWLGVVMFSIVYGYFMESINQKVLYYIRHRKMVNAYSSFLFSKIAFCMMISSGFFTLYVLYIPLIIIYHISKKKNFNVSSPYL